MILLSCPPGGESGRPCVSRAGAWTLERCPAGRAPPPCWPVPCFLSPALKLNTGLAGAGRGAQGAGRGRAAGYLLDFSDAPRRSEAADHAR